MGDKNDRSRRGRKPPLPDQQAPQFLCLNHRPMLEISCELSYCAALLLSWPSASRNGLRPNEAEFVAVILMARAGPAAWGTPVATTTGDMATVMPTPTHTA